MKRIFSFLLFAFLIFTTGNLLAIEVGALFSMGNLTLGDRTETTSTISGTTFPWSIEVTGTEKLNDMFTLEAGFYRDPILRNTAYTLFTYQIDFLHIGVGPFFGIFNSTGTILKSGIVTSLRIEVPGITFVEFRSDSTIGGRLVSPGEYLQSRSDVSAGFYLRNAIMSVNLRSKEFIEKTATGELIDKQVDYEFQTNIFQKNVPYRILLTLGYRTLTKSWVPASGTTTTHTLNSILIGTKFDLALSDNFSLIGDLESSVYNFGTGGAAGTDPLTMPASGIGIFLFNARIGFSLNLDVIYPEPIVIK